MLAEAGTRLKRKGCRWLRGALERRHQLWRRDRLHLRRPDRAPDHQYLPQILWLESDRFRRRHFLFRNGRGCVDHRVCISNSQLSSARAKSSGRRSLNLLQLYDCIEHHFSNGGRFSGYPVSQDYWRTKDVGADGLMSDLERGSRDQSFAQPVLT
jgi:hypothetical protein